MFNSGNPMNMIVIKDEVKTPLNLPPSENFPLGIFVLKNTVMVKNARKDNSKALNM
jgi:hypothetical protein